MSIRPGRLCKKLFQVVPFIQTPRFLFIATLVLVVYLVGGPLAILLFSTLKSTKAALPFEPNPFTLSNYARVYLDPRTYILFSNTLFFTAGSLAIGIPLSFSFAWVVERTNIPYRNLIYSLMLLPMAIPGMLVAMGWILLLSPRIGLFNFILRGIFGLTGEGPFNIYTIPGMFFC